MFGVRRSTGYAVCPRVGCIDTNSVRLFVECGQRSSEGRSDPHSVFLGDAIRSVL
jgi:hypothetical protein